jgi:hypothetical protein
VPLWIEWSSRWQSGTPYFGKAALKVGIETSALLKL